jgi:hypothetical protein
MTISVDGANHITSCSGNGSESFWAANGASIDYMFGNIGVGTSAPTELIQVQGNNPGLAVTDTSVAGNQALFQAAGVGVGPLIESHTDSAGNSTFNTQAHRLLFGNSGYHVAYSATTAVGAARAWTDHLLVDNTGSLWLPTYGAGTLTTVAGGQVTIVSDERLKNIQGPFTLGLKELAQLQPIIYKWKKSSGLETEHEYAGFSAQNVKSVLPVAVGQDARGFLSLQDRPIIAAAVNAIKELLSKLTGMDVRVQKLEKENTELKARLDRLEQSITRAPAGKK